MPSLSELLRPIPGPNASGEDTRYTSLYVLIKEARREELDLPQGVWAHERKTADWDAVVNLCTDALINRTKDLQIAAWLTEALIHRDGFPGLEQGLNLLRGLVDQFWSTVYPSSEEDELGFRGGVLEWVGSRLDVSVKSVALTPGVGSELDFCLVALGQLHAICEARFGDMTPHFDGLRKSLETVKRTVERLSGEMAGNASSTYPANWNAVEPDVPSGEMAGNASSTYPANWNAVEPDVTQPAARMAAPAQLMDSEIPLDRLHFTLTAPPAIHPGNSFVVTLWVHLESQRATVVDRACQQYRASDLVGFMSVSKGPVRIARGTILTVRLSVSEASVEDPEDSVLWDGEIGCANFVVTLPTSPDKQALPGIAMIYLNGVKIAKVQFVLQVGTTPTDSTVATTETRVRRAFASYASADRDEVLGRLQGIRKAAPYLDIFFDVLTLRSGQSWEREIDKLIPASDVFYLFWSINASNSKWVEREWRTALLTGRRDFIDPVPLQSPEEAPPPAELASLHFNDWMLAFRRRKLSRCRQRIHLSQRRFQIERKSLQRSNLIWLGLLLEIFGYEV